MFVRSVGTKIFSKNMDNCPLSYTIMVWPQIRMSVSMYIGLYVVENGCTRGPKTFDTLWQSAWFKDWSVMSLPRLNDYFLGGKSGFAYWPVLACSLWRNCSHHYTNIPTIRSGRRMTVKGVLIVPSIQIQQWRPQTENMTYKPAEWPSEKKSCIQVFPH